MNRDEKVVILKWNEEATELIADKNIKVYIAQDYEVKDEVVEPNPDDNITPAPPTAEEGGENVENKGEGNTESSISAQSDELDATTPEIPNENPENPKNDGEENKPEDTKPKIDTLYTEMEYKLDGGDTFKDAKELRIHLSNMDSSIDMLNPIYVVVKTEDIKGSEETVVEVSYINTLRTYEFTITDETTEIHSFLYPISHFDNKEPENPDTPTEPDDKNECTCECPVCKAARGEEQHKCECGHDGCLCAVDKEEEKIDENELLKLVKEYIEKNTNISDQTCIIVPRNDTSSNWELNDPVLEFGEYGVENDTHRVKRGDGQTCWKDLPFETFGLSNILSPSASEIGYDNENSKVEEYTVQDIIDFIIEELDTQKELFKGREKISNKANSMAFEDVKEPQVEYPTVKAVVDYIREQLKDVITKDNISITDLGIEEPPESGNYVLGSIDGKLKWVGGSTPDIDDDIIVDDDGNVIYKPEYASIKLVFGTDTVYWLKNIRLIRLDGKDKTEETENDGISLLSAVTVVDDSSINGEIVSKISKYDSVEEFKVKDAGKYQVIIDFLEGNWESITIDVEVNLGEIRVFDDIKLNKGNKEVYKLNDIEFKNAVVEYDGNEHSIEVNGDIPEGIKVIYANNTLTKIGSTTAVATFIVDSMSEFGKNYYDVEVNNSGSNALAATLTIIKSGGTTTPDDDDIGGPSSGENNGGTTSGGENEGGETPAPPLPQPRTR